MAVASSSRLIRPSLSMSSTCIDSPILLSTWSSSLSRRSKMLLTLLLSRSWPTTSTSSPGRSTDTVPRWKVMGGDLPASCLLVRSISPRTSSMNACRSADTPDEDARTPSALSTFCMRSSRAAAALADFSSALSPARVSTTEAAAASRITALAAAAAASSGALSREGRVWPSGCWAAAASAPSSRMRASSRFSCSSFFSYCLARSPIWPTSRPTSSSTSLLSAPRVFFSESRSAAAPPLPGVTPPVEGAWVSVNARESSSRLLGSILLRDSSSHSERRLRMSLEAPSPNTLARMPRARHASLSSDSLSASRPSALMARSSALMAASRARRRTRRNSSVPKGVTPMKRHRLVRCTLSRLSSVSSSLKSCANFTSSALSTSSPARTFCMNWYSSSAEAAAEPPRLSRMSLAMSATVS
mmetsp:Transcript_17598/g.52869  ORF Transcript_17598/g.52869 Transcript_17598/m.52869 type:complete len:415 (-) Transcript_17598:1246-2490(-)